MEPGCRVVRLFPRYIFDIASRSVLPISVEFAAFRLPRESSCTCIFHLIFSISIDSLFLSFFTKSRFKASGSVSACVYFLPGFKSTDDGGKPKTG